MHDSYGCREAIAMIMNRIPADPDGCHSCIDILARELYFFDLTFMMDDGCSPRVVCESSGQPCHRDQPLHLLAEASGTYTWVSELRARFSHRSHCFRLSLLQESLNRCSLSTPYTCKSLIHPSPELVSVPHPLTQQVHHQLDRHVQLTSVALMYSPTWTQI